MQWLELPLQCWVRVVTADILLVPDFPEKAFYLSLLTMVLAVGCLMDVVYKAVEFPFYFSESFYHE